MPLEQGPLKLLDPSVVNYDVISYDFTDDIVNVWTEIDVFTAEIDFLLPDAIAAAAEPEDPAPDASLDDMIVEFGGDPTISMFTDQSAIEDQVGINDNQFIAAVAMAPGDSWSPPEPPYIPPGATGPGGKPITPAPPVSPAEAAGAYLMAPPIGYAFTLTNLTQYGASAFTVGDQWAITIQGNPGGAVTAGAWHDGNPQGTTPFGNLGTDGQWSLQGTMGPDEVGNWVEWWYVDQTLVMELEFNVAPQSGG